MEDIENVKKTVLENAAPDSSLIIDRDAIKDLALRISVGVMRGDVSELGLSDIELLREYLKMPPTKAQLAKIHIAIKDLGLSNEIYRDILFVNFKVKSSSKLNQFSADQLLDIFKAKGWKAKSAKKKGISPKLDNPQQRKVQALWITMAKAGKIRNGSDPALQKYVKRLTKVDNLKWCGEAECCILIESLKSWTKRENVDVR